MGSKYEIYKEEIAVMLKNDPELDSVHIAHLMCEKYDGLTIEGLGRWIRKTFTVHQGVPAKILIFDLETSPLIGYAWRKWDVNITDDMIIRPWHLLTWSAKWLFEDKVYSMKMTKKEIKNCDDKRIAKGIWKMLDEADIVIAHNLKRFDKRRANEAFLRHGLFLPSQYKEIDTLRVARSMFDNMSNRLDALAEKLGVGRKMDTPKGLWRRAIEGDMEAVDIMDTYCKQDSRVLEDVYLKLRPYITNHPNIGLFIDSDVEVCKNCGSDDLKPNGGNYATAANLYEGLRCNTCGAIHRSRKPITSKEVRDRLIK